MAVACVFSGVTLRGARDAERTGTAVSRIIVVRDREPDDRLALHLLAGRVRAQRMALVGTTVLHA
jgi:hypothetical protein